MSDFQNSYLNKLFVRVPEGVSFDGQTVSANSWKIYFDEANDVIWAKGNEYGISETFKSYVTTLRQQVGASTDEAAADGSLYARIAAAVVATNELRAATYAYTDTLYASQSTPNSISYIAYDVAADVINSALGVADADNVINQINEVIEWFENVTEGSYGAQLVRDVASHSSYIGDPATTTGVENGTIYEQLIYVKSQISQKNVSASGESGADALVYSYADANHVYTYSSDKLTSAVAKAETAAQSISGEAVDSPLISVSSDGTSYTVQASADLKSAVTAANSAVQSITSNGTDLITVSYSGSVYTISYTADLGTAVSNANSAIQGIKIASYNLDKTNNELSADQLKGIVLGGAAGTATYTDAASDITVTITYANGVITDVTLSGATIDGRVDDIEGYINNYNPWEDYAAAGGGE